MAREVTRLRGLVRRMRVKYGSWQRHPASQHQLLRPVSFLRLSCRKGALAVGRDVVDAYGKPLDSMTSEPVISMLEIKDRAEVSWPYRSSWCTVRIWVANTAGSVVGRSQRRFSHT